MQLVEPHGLSAEELLNRKLSDEEVIRAILTRGGEMVDRELAHQLKEFWDLAVKYNVTNFS